MSSLILKAGRPTRTEQPLPLVCELTHLPGVRDTPENYYHDSLRVLGLPRQSGF